VAGAFAGAQSAIALFGGESEEVNKALLKVQASLGLVAAAQELANLATGQAPLKLAVLSAAQTLYSSAIDVTSKKLNIFKAALITTGLGALIVALGFVIAKLQEFAATSAAAAAAVKAANAAQIQSSKDLIKAQLELDVARGKITQAEFDRQTALATFTTKLSAEILAQKRRVADAELEIESAKQKRLLILITAPLVDANKVVRDAEAKKASIIADGEKTIANLRGEFNAQEQKRILDATKAEKDAAVTAAVEKAEAVIKIERTYQEISGQLILAQSKKRFADVAVLEAQLNVLRNKDSIDAQEALIKAKLRADLLGLELEYQAAIKQDNDLEAAKAEYLAKIILAEQQAANEIVDINKKADEKINKSNQKLATNKIETAGKVTKAKKKSTATEEENEKAALDLSIQATNATFDLFNSIGDARIAKLEENAATEIELAGDDARKKAEIEKKLADEVAKIKRSQAIADKAQALFNIAINTAQGVMKATGTGAAPLIPLIIALGALQAAAVAARPIPKFEKGGYVKGPRHSQGGVLAELEGDEFITNRNATKKNRPLLEAINGGKEKSAFCMFILIELLLRTRTCTSFMILVII
jgi:hypothetical protein